MRCLCNWRSITDALGEAEFTNFFQAAECNGSQFAAPPGHAAPVGSRPQRRRPLAGEGVAGGDKEAIGREHRGGGSHSPRGAEPCGFGGCFGVPHRRGPACRCGDRVAVP